MLAKNAVRMSLPQVTPIQHGLVPRGIIVITREKRLEPEIKIIRDNYTLKSAVGQMFLGGSETRFCYTLEDVPRDVNIKIPKHTAIPAGIYNWKVTRSNRFKRDMILIYNHPIDYSIQVNGISFTGVRIHGGNDDGDTEGCPLVAYAKISNDRIYGTAEKELTAWAKRAGGEGTIIIENKS